MPLSRIFVAVTCLFLLYSGCKKNESSSTQNMVRPNDKATAMTFYSPAHFATGVVESDAPITDFKWLEAQLNEVKTVAPAATIPPAVTPTYYGNTRTYDCTSNSWTYTFTWELYAANTAMVTAMTPLSASLTVGTYSHTVTPVVLNTYTRMLNGLPIGTVVLFDFVVSIPDDANYCSNSTMQNAFSFSYNQRNAFTHTTTTINAGSGATENLDPNTYIIYPYLVTSVVPQGNNVFNILVVPGVLACGPCHESALGFSPTMYFYYHLVGSSAPWSSVATPGTNLSQFYVTVTQPGVYEYYTQGYISPGVLSGQLYNGTISVQ